jgi:signal transduction histidine kinase
MLLDETLHNRSAGVPPRSPAATAAGPRLRLERMAVLPAFVAAVALAVELLLDGGQTPTLVSWTAAGIFACLGAWSARRRAAAADRRAWSLILAACALWLAGQLIYDWYAIVGHPASPNAADAGWLAFPVLAAVATYRLAPLATHARAVARLECLPLVVAAATVVWACLAGDFHDSALPLSEKVTALAYAITYVVLPIVMLQGLLGGAVRLKSSPDLLLVLVGLAAEAVAFMAWSTQLLGETYVPGRGLIDVLWTAGMLSVGAGGLLHGRRTTVIRPTARVATLLPGLTFLAVVGSLIITAATDAGLDVQVPLQVGLLAIGAALTARSAVLARQQERLLADQLAVQEELERSNRELEQFAYVASHDLAEPLRSIRSFSQFLENEYSDRLDDNAREYLDHITGAAARMRSLIDALLEYSRVGRARPAFQPVATSEVVADVLAGLRATIEESDARVTCGTLPVVAADRSELTRVFQNLVANAIKFVADGPPDIRIGATRERAHWRFSVVDNGIGVEPQYAERIFAMFKRLHSRDHYPGTGIGLTVARRIIERHGGRLWVEPATGGGSAFMFTVRTTAEARS